MPEPGSQFGHGTRLRMGTLTLQSDENLAQFLRPGTFIWQPPRGLRAVRIVKANGGAGGGGGRCDVAGAIRCGGGGGGGSATCDHTIPMQTTPHDRSSGGLFIPWRITVGIGGAGGAGSAVVANGVGGTAGTLTTITWDHPQGGAAYAIGDADIAPTGGGGGTINSGTAGAAGTGQTVGGTFIGQIGGAASTTGLLGVAPTPVTSFGACGGGSAGGLTAANVTSAGGVGGSYQVVVLGHTVTPPVAGIAGGGNGVNGLPSLHIGRPGLGGSGGGSAASGAAGNGGNGIFGSGGGGGGAGISVTGNSGNGGKGGDGFLLIFLIW